MQSKKFYRFLLGSLCAATLLFTSCGDDEMMENSFTFTCKIDGVQWEAETVELSVVQESLFAPGIYSKTMTFTGISSDGVSIKIEAVDFRSTDTGECLNIDTYYGVSHPNFDMNHVEVSPDGSEFENFSQCVYFPDNTNPLAAFIGANAEVNLTSCEDGKVSGQFSFVGEDIGFTSTVEVTEGVFSNIEYTFQE